MFLSQIIHTYTTHIHTYTTHKHTHYIYTHYHVSFTGATGPKLKDFKAAVANPAVGEYPAVDALKADVVAFSRSFPTVGF